MAKFPEDLKACPCAGMKPAKRGADWTPPKCMDRETEADKAKRKGKRG